MHFGELGNLAFLRPNYAKAVADVVKGCGGLPFLTDCNTLYPGSRKHALEHLDCANLNGFNTITTGCQIIIVDGLRGTDDIIVPVPNGENKKAWIDPDKCVGCGRCIGACAFDAIENINGNAPKLWSRQRRSV